MKRIAGSIVLVAALSGCAMFQPDPETGVTPAEVGITVGAEKAQGATNPLGLILAIAAGIGAAIAAKTAAEAKREAAKKPVA